MVQFRFRAAALLVAASLLSLAAAAGELNPIDEAKFLQMNNLEGVGVEYRDVDGQPLSYAEFFKRMVSGQKFSKITESANADSAKRVVFKFQSVSTGNLLGKVDAGAISVGQPVPAMPLVDSEGKAVRLEAFRGRKVLLSFYFSECTPCIREVPELNAFAAAHPEIETLAVTFDDAGTAREFAAKYDFSWRAVVDAKAFIEALGVQSYPHFVLVDEEGDVLGRTRSSTIATKEESWPADVPKPKSDDGEAPKLTELSAADLALWVESLSKA